MFDDLRAMLGYCRPAGSTQDRLFCRDWIAPLPGAYQDRWHNWHVHVSDDPILWSCHTDTVHRLSVRQRVIWVGEYLTLPARTQSSCLGADDTAGVWLMRELIAARVPGHYIFHYGEERGCIGSRALAEHHADWLRTFKMAIALDRKGTTDVITHQSFGRCCSQDFALALCRKLGPDWRPTAGVYTDTAEYTSHIPECTNLSVGYNAAHSPDEYLDTAHLAQLRAALIGLNYDDLPIVRDPASDDDDLYRDYRRRDDWITPSRYDDPFMICLDCRTADTLSETDGEHCRYCGGPIELDDLVWHSRPRHADHYLSPEYAAVARALDDQLGNK